MCRSESRHAIAIELAVKLYESQPALFKAAYQGNVSDVRTLLDQGENTEARGFDTKTPVMAATENGHLEVVRLLVSANANVDAVDEWGNTPLMYAVGHPKIVRVLLDSFSDITIQNNRGDTALQVAAQWENTESIILLQEAEAAKTEWEQFAEEMQESFAEP